MALALLGEKRGTDIEKGSGSKEHRENAQEMAMRLPVQAGRQQGIDMQSALENYQAGLSPCPICGKPVVLAPVLEKRTGVVLWGITCARQCFPRDLYVCQQEELAAAQLVQRWRTEIVPAMEKWKGLSARSPRCPHCDKPTRLLPVPDKSGVLAMRPVCVQQGCHLPSQWHFSPTIWKPSEMVGQVRRWSRERLQFVLWFSKKLNPALYKKPGVLSCPVCHGRGKPVLQRSSDFVGEVLWACAECGTAICPAEKAPKAGRKRRSKTARVPLRALDTPMCAICHRTQSEVEASGSRLEKHHRVPLADGGDDSTANLLILCRECHEAWHKAHQKVRDELREQAVAEALPLVEAQPKRGLWQRLKDLLGL